MNADKTKAQFLSAFICVYRRPMPFGFCPPSHMMPALSTMALSDQWFRKELSDWRNDPRRGIERIHEEVPIRLIEDGAGLIGESMFGFLAGAPDDETSDR
jgi:hypothetical protein